MDHNAPNTRAPGRTDAPLARVPDFYAVNRHRRDRMAALGPLPLFAILISIGYLVFLPPGLPGMVLCLVSMALGCVGVSRESLGVISLLFAPPIFGLVLRMGGVPHVGAPLAMLLGLILLLGFKPSRRMSVGEWRQPILWLAMTTGVLCVAYLYGPRTEYAQAKLVGFVVPGLLCGVVAYRIVVGSHDLDFWTLGVLGVVASVLYYSMASCYWPGGMPGSVWDVAGIESIARVQEGEAPPGNTMASLAVTGIALALGSSLDKMPSWPRILGLFAALGAGMLVVNSCGHRLSMVIPPVAAISVFLCRPRSWGTPMVGGAMLLVALLGIIVVGLESENATITSVLAEDRSVTQRINREEDWDAAMRRIAEKPVFGHGLGGYYVDGTTVVGERAYAHNLVLELLSETGIVGTIAILGPVVAFFLVGRGRHLWRFRVPGGSSVVPLLVVSVLIAMMTLDLRFSSWLFALFGVVWAYAPRRMNAA